MHEPPVALAPADQRALIERLRAAVGAAQVLTEPAELEPALVDWRGFYRGSALAVVRPASTEEVAAVVRLCAAARVAIVPQGGNTGMCGAATPPAGGASIVLSLARMNRVLALDTSNDTITVQAGCVLADIQRRAAEAGRLFPLSLGAEGSCQIGGNLATNAGGVNVLRYGNTRELTLGLEVVLADGRVWGGLRALRKDNTGYDLKQLFIGSEGTLGVITGAVLRLFPLPRVAVTAFAAVPGPTAAIELLGRLRAALGSRVSAFELMQRYCLELVLAHIPGTRDPLATASPWYVLTTVDDAGTGSGLREALEAVLAEAMEAELVGDAVLAASDAQAAALWRIRESIPEAARNEGLLYRHDISVPAGDIPGFIDEGGRRLAAAYPGVRIVCFGHVGDGNLHYNCYVPGRRRDDPAALAATDVNELVYALVRERHGSISAEHGIGQAKLDELEQHKSAVEIELMRRVKQALDPLGIMNPGKVIRPAGPRPPAG
jgi:FAD/FMN-containing dehydrogenase